MVKLKRCNEISDYDDYWNEEGGLMESIETSIKMNFRLINNSITATVYGKTAVSGSIKNKEVKDSYTISMKELGYSSKWLQDIKEIIDKQTDNKDLDNVRDLSVEDLQICLITWLFKQNDNKVFKMTDFNESEGFWIQESKDLKDAISEDSAIVLLNEWLIEFLTPAEDDVCIKAIVEGEKNLKGTFNISFEDKSIEEKEIELDPPERYYDDYYYIV
jgi:hypothetical protein